MTLMKFDLSRAWLVHHAWERFRGVFEDQIDSATVGLKDSSCAQ